MRGAAEPPDPELAAGEPGRWINCGTVLAGLGFLAFAFFGWLLVQFLCTGQGAPGGEWMTPSF